MDSLGPRANDLQLALKLRGFPGSKGATTLEEKPRIAEWGMKPEGLAGKKET